MLAMLVITLSIMFFKLSTKLYTSVFHHGLKAGELQQGTAVLTDRHSGSQKELAPLLGHSLSLPRPPSSSSRSVARSHPAEARGGEAARRA